MIKKTRIGYLTSYNYHELEWAKKAGFESIQLIVKPGQNLDPTITSEKEILEAKEHLESLDIEVSALGFYANHLDPDPVKQRLNNEHLLNLFHLAQILEVKTIGTFTGRDPEKDIPDNIPQFTKTWTPIVKEAEDRGLQIAFENCPMFKSFPYRGINLAYTPRAWDLMFDAIDSTAIGIEYDPSHLICQMIDYIDVVYRYGSKIKHVHAKDAEITPQVKINGIFEPNSVRHRTPGYGSVDWRKLYSALIEVGYEGNLDIEGLHDPVFHQERDRQGLLLSLKHLTQLVVDPQNQPVFSTVLSK
jgi:sugar phosphate isomerase/epimerase